MTGLDPERFGPFGEKYLVIEFSAMDAPAPSSLRTLPCPVIGVGDAADTLAPACDVVVPDERALAPLLANIERAPIAAATLVQVLRITETLPLHEALLVESLAYATLQGGAENRAWLAARSPTPPAPAEPGPPVLVAREGDRLALMLNRPGGRNAVTMELRDALVEALRLAALDATICDITLHGAGKCFCIGGALEEFGSVPDQAIAHAVRTMRGPAFALAPVAARVRARVHGAAIGAGAELASLCGHVAAHRCSFFQLPEIRFGLIPGSGGTAGFSQRIGRQRTAWMALSARRVGARQALAWGLIDEIFPA
ncbi:MAG: enoyl-CoA hydratase/isomerase family protein [Rhodospirillales bacterium]